MAESTARFGKTRSVWTRSSCRRRSTLTATPWAEGDLRNFAGAIDAAGTTKGVFVTTAGFTRAARDYVARSPKRIVLIDGEELARLMVQNGVGVPTRIHHEIKRIDEDYFDQEAI